jgi:hypothetical protein
MKGAFLLWIGLAMVVSMRPVHAQDFSEFRGVRCPVLHLDRWFRPPPHRGAHG